MDPTYSVDSGQAHPRRYRQTRATADQGQLVLLFAVLILMAFTAWFVMSTPLPTLLPGL